MCAEGARAAHPELESQPWTSAFAQDYGAHPTLAALFRQIARDEAAHRDHSLQRMAAPRFEARVLGDALRVVGGSRS